MVGATGRTLNGEEEEKHKHTQTHTRACFVFAATLKNVEMLPLSQSPWRSVMSGQVAKGCPGVRNTLSTARNFSNDTRRFPSSSTATSRLWFDSNSFRTCATGSRKSGP